MSEGMGDKMLRMLIELYADQCGVRVAIKEKPANCFSAKAVKSDGATVHG